MAMVDNTIYDKVAKTWWDEDGFMAILRTGINPARYQYFENVLIKMLQLNPVGLRVLDVGCGGGLLAEKLAAMGCSVVGVDKSPATLDVAKEHSVSMGLNITYLEANAESLPFADDEFDVVFCCDVLEHVDSVDTVIKGIARVLKPDGVFFFDTINRTLMSKLVAIKIAQDCPLTRFIPRDVHVWEKFIKPQELASTLRSHRFSPISIRGLAPKFKPFGMLAALVRCKLGKISFAEFGEKTQLFESDNTAISYMGYSTLLRN